MSLPRLRVALVLAIAAAFVAGCTSSALPDTESAQAQAERKAAAEHFGNGQYADVTPIGAEEAAEMVEAQEAKDKADAEAAATEAGDAAP
jgi:hypothetical protein